MNELSYSKLFYCGLTQPKYCKWSKFKILGKRFVSDLCSGPGQVLISSAKSMQDLPNWGKILDPMRINGKFFPNKNLALRPNSFGHFNSFQRSVITSRLELCVKTIGPIYDSFESLFCGAHNRLSWLKGQLIKYLWNNETIGVSFLLLCLKFLNR